MPNIAKTFKKILKETILDILRNSDEPLCSLEIYKAICRTNDGFLKRLAHSQYRIGQIMRELHKEGKVEIIKHPSYVSRLYKIKED